MYYYAEINSNYQVIATYSLSSESTNENYIAITESQYLDDSLIGKFYNKLTNTFEYLDWENVGYIGDTNHVQVMGVEGFMLSTKLDNMEFDINNIADGVSNCVSQSDLNSLENIVNTKANAVHSHSEYALSDDLTMLTDIVNTKADDSHVHSEYASVNHGHDDYALQISLDGAVETLESKIDEKSDIGHSHSEYSEITHNHDEDYSPLSHSHTASEIGAATDEHNHDSDYASISALDELFDIISNKANVSHTHDDRYYTETEVDAKLSSKSDSSHTHTGIYDVSGSAASALSSAQAYTDSKIDALVGEGASVTLDTIGEISVAIEDNQDAIDLLNSAIGTKANATDLNSHVNDTEIHITDAERDVWNAKSNFSGNYNDLTNKPSIPSISGLATEDYVDEALSTKANSSHTHGDIYYTETEIDSLLSTKANSNHNHNSSYDALGTAETKANAVQANLDVVSENLTEHIDNADIHFTTTERNKLSGIATNANNYTHPNSGVTAGTYKSVTVNAQGHITGGTNPTTLAGYGITDAETKGSANSALTSAKAYADGLIADEVANRDSAIATAKSSAISTASSDATTKANNALASAKTYADNAATTVKNDLLNNAGTAYDTLKELGDLIDDNTDAIEALEVVASGKANEVHAHAISDITNLQSTLNGKAATSHGTHVTYSTTAPVMDGTASVGSASTVARSDHKHPTDTSRAAQIDLDALETVVAGKANSSHTHTIANVTNLQSTLDGKASSSHTHTVANISDLTATAKELNYMDGVISNVQAQLDSKATSGHTHSYAGSSSVGGSANSAVKLDSSAGSATQPIYFSDGKPVATTYTLEKSVPSNAVFTDTHYASKNVVGATNATSNTSTALANGAVYLNSVENGSITSTHKISGSGATTVTTDTSGNIVISSTDNNTTYSAAGSSLGLVKSGGDVTISSGVITVNDDSHNHTIANVDNLQSSLDAKQATITGGATTIASSDLTVSRALVSNSSGKVDVSAVTSTELGYLDGVTSNIQTQLDTHKHCPTPVTTANTDLNDYTTEGLYSFAQAYTPVNVPSGNTNGWLLVMQWTETHKATIKQIWFRHGSVNNNDHETYVRTKLGDYGWSSWKRYFTSNGGTITGNVVLSDADIYAGNMYINENGADTGIIYAKSPSGTYVDNLKPCNENGNCVIGWGNYDRGEGDTNIYGDNVHIYALNSDGSKPSGAVFVGRNDSNHTLINHEAHVNTSKISDTYIYGRAVHIDTNDTNFIVDSIQLAHTDKATITSYSSGWDVYGTSSGNTPVVRRYGKIVSLTGAITNTTDVTLNTTHVKVFTIPSGYRPPQDVLILCQGSGSQEYLLQIKSNGEVFVGRYGTSSFSAIAADSWFPFHTTWIME